MFLSGGSSPLINLFLVVKVVDSGPWRRRFWAATIVVSARGWSFWGKLLRSLGIVIRHYFCLYFLSIFDLTSLTFLIPHFPFMSILLCFLLLCLIHMWNGGTYNENCSWACFHPLIQGPVSGNFQGKDDQPDTVINLILPLKVSQCFITGGQGKLPWSCLSKPVAR